MAAPPPPDPAVLMDELVEQCLLRLPPEDPADLARAALVSKQWHRVVTGAIFRRRYIEFHRSAPLLGYMLNLHSSTCFVHLSSFRPPHAELRGVHAIHSSHGRVLLRPIRYSEMRDIYLFVWDPITDKQWALPVVPGPRISYWDAAVVCAVGDGCSHLDCHFKVVVVGMSGERTFSCFYSSEADSWSDPIFALERGYGGYFMQQSVLVGNDLYFWRRGSAVLAIIFKYDLLTNQMCTFSVHCEAQVQLPLGGLLIATEDGRLGVAKTIYSTLCLCLKEQGRWAQSRVIQLHALLPPEAAEDKPWVSGFAETGAGVIFLWTCVGRFAIDLNSWRSKKVGESFGSVRIFPYVSFCTPAPGTISTDEGPGSSVVISADDEPGADAVASRDEGPRDVVVSTDEGPAGVSSA